MRDTATRPNLHRQAKHPSSPSYSFVLASPLELHSDSPTTETSFPLFSSPLQVLGFWVVRTWSQQRPKALIFRDFSLYIHSPASSMAAKMKGFCKSFKIISQIFVVKEKEIEIGFPTDIQHVAHIGWDGSGTPPSWMSEYKSAPDFLTSLGSIGESGDNSSIPRSTWSSQDFEQILMAPPTGEVFKDQVPPGIPNPKKKTRKKNSSTSSSSSSSSSKSSLLSKERFHF